jgi:hypothetical protein
MTMEYRVEMSRSIMGIEDRVNYQMARGWIPQGGISHVDTSMYTYYEQAMIKLEPDGDGD